MAIDHSNYRKNRDNGRKNRAVNAQEIYRRLEMLLRANHVQASTQQTEDFMNWLIGDAWNNYRNYRMNRRILVKNIIDSTPIVIPNATQGTHYESGVIELPKEGLEYEFSGLGELGLLLVDAGEENCFVITGTPMTAGDFRLKLTCKYDGWHEGDELVERELPFAINANPRIIMEQSQKPTPTDTKYYKADKVCEYVKVESGEDGTPRKDIVAASSRGRSHGREAKPRDDHFRLYHGEDNDWYVIAVADGAGSAKYSRRGSEIACNTAVDFCVSKLADASEFEETIKAYKRSDDFSEEIARKEVGNRIYNIVGNAAFQAHRAIAEEARNTDDATTKDFATTLLLTICKKFDFGWFVASFWVGDGAICLYDAKTGTARLLGVPDEGEYSGQTRFLTMPEIFADYTALYKRLRFNIVDDFTALFLMSDGVSDPMFGTDANLNNVEKWNEFWRKLHDGFPEDGIGGVDLSDDNEDSKEQLLRWLDFWMRGEHDDRTLAIMY